MTLRIANCGFRIDNVQVVTTLPSRSLQSGLVLRGVSIRNPQSAIRNGRNL